MFACLISWLGACLQVRCPVWRLHVQLTKEHSTRAPYIKDKEHSTRAPQIYKGRRASRAFINMGGRPLRGGPPISIAAVISPVYVHACVLCSFVWRACVVLFCVARVCCALLSAASARPAGKPPAKRLGKQTYASISQKYILTGGI